MPKGVPVYVFPSHTVVVPGLAVNVKCRNTGRWEGVLKNTNSARLRSKKDKQHQQPVKRGVNRGPAGSINIPDKIIKWKRRAVSSHILNKFQPI